ncbi:MAG: hypothetical protein V2A78_09455 [bacterium]
MSTAVTIIGIVIIIILVQLMTRKKCCELLKHYTREYVVKAAWNNSAGLSVFLFLILLLLMSFFFQKWFYLLPPFKKLWLLVHKYIPRQRVDPGMRALYSTIYTVLCGFITFIVSALAVTFINTSISSAVARAIPKHHDMVL